MDIRRANYQVSMKSYRNACDMGPIIQIAADGILMVTKPDSKEKLQLIL